MGKLKTATLAGTVSLPTTAGKQLVVHLHEEAIRGYRYVFCGGSDAHITSGLNATWLQESCEGLRCRSRAVPMPVATVARMRKPLPYASARSHAPAVATRMHIREYSWH